MITDINEARKLAAAGLLWYEYTGRVNPALGGGPRVVDWVPAIVDKSAKPHWQFYLLLEE